MTNDHPLSTIHHLLKMRCHQFLLRVPILQWQWWFFFFDSHPVGEKLDKGDGVDGPGQGPDNRTTNMLAKSEARSPIQKSGRWGMRKKR